MKKLSSAIALLLLICMLGGCSSPKNAKDPDMQTVADKVGDRHKRAFAGPGRIR